MHRPLPAALVLALSRELTLESLLGRWRADVGSYDFSPTEAIVTIARTGERRVLRIRSIDIKRRTIVVYWTDDGAPGSHTTFGKFTEQSMTQLPEWLHDGALGPERKFYRCP